MAIHILDSGATISVEFTVDYNAGHGTIAAGIRNINKDDFNVSSQGNFVVINDGNTKEEFRIVYTDVTTPSGASASAVRATIEAYLDSSGGATQDTNLTKVGGSAVTLGQAVAASSIPVVLASDQWSTSSGVTNNTTQRVVLANNEPLPTGENHLGNVGGILTKLNVEITRPSNTTAYAANDAVSDSATTPTLFSFPNIARTSGGSGYIVKLRLMTDQSTNTARFRIHLYNTAPTPINDNAAHTLLYADFTKRIGMVTFDALTTEGSGSTAAGASMQDVRVAFNCDSGSRTIYFLLETLDAFTPASGQKFYIEATVDNN